MKDAVRARYARSATELPHDETPPSLGVGDPVALAALRPGETVLDLGSGPGRDLLAAADAVGPSGRAIGVDMTPEMIERAREAAEGRPNVSILEGDLEGLPLPSGSVDVVISNCVINLTDDKRRVLAEAFRVLTPGGRLAVMDTSFDAEPPSEVRDDPDAWSCCVGGSLVASDYEGMLRDVGFTDVRLERQDGGCTSSCSTGEVTAASTAVTARKPAEASGETLRPAVPADRDRIEGLLTDADLPTDVRTEDAIVAGDAGVVALERFDAAALLRSLAVSADRRSEGLGSRLTQAAIEVARAAGASEMFLLTPASTQGFFERHGFVPVSRKRAGSACRSEQFSHEVCADAVALRLELAAAEPMGTPTTKRELPLLGGGSCC